MSSDKRQTLIPEPLVPDALASEPVAPAPPSAPEPLEASTPLDPSLVDPDDIPTLHDFPVAIAEPDEPHAELPSDAPGTSPAPVPPDPLARARAALDAARQARGAEEDDEPVRPLGTASDPMARAQAALDAARAARGHRASTDRKLDDALYEAELRKLKKGRDL